MPNLAMASFRPRRPRLLALLVVALSVVLAACSVVRMAYNQADTLAYWQLNRAFDFNDAQSAKVHSGIRQWLQWHRHTQLPIYAQFAARAQKEALGSLTPALACERRSELEAWGRKAVDQAVPFMAEMLLSLSPEQIKHLEKYQAKMNDDFKDDFLQDDAKDRDKAATKFVLKWAGLFYGSMTSEQEEQLRQDIARLPLNAQDVFQERDLYQKAFVQMIRQLIAQNATQAQAEQALRALFQQFFEPTQEPFRKQRALWISTGCELMASLHERTTAEQRRKAAKRLSDWEADFRLLAKQPS